MLVSPYPYTTGVVEPLSGLMDPWGIDPNGRVCVPCSRCNQYNRLGANFCSHCRSELHLPRKGWFQYGGESSGGFCLDVGYLNVGESPGKNWEISGDNQLLSRDLRLIQPILVDDLIVMAQAQSGTLIAASQLSGKTIWRTSVYSPLQSYSQLAVLYPYLYFLMDDPEPKRLWYLARISIFDGEFELLLHFQAPPATGSTPLLVSLSDNRTLLISALTHSLLGVEISSDDQEVPWKSYLLPCPELREPDYITGLAAEGNRVFAVSRLGKVYGVDASRPLAGLALDGCKVYGVPPSDALCSRPCIVAGHVVFLECRKNEGLALYARSMTLKGDFNEPVPLILPGGDGEQAQNEEDAVLENGFVSDGTLPFIPSPHSPYFYLYRPMKNAIEPISMNGRWPIAFIASTRDRQIAVVEEGEGRLLDGLTQGQDGGKPFQLSVLGNRYSPLFRPLFGLLGMVVVSKGRVFLFPYSPSGR